MWDRRFAVIGLLCSGGCFHRARTDWDGDAPRAPMIRFSERVAPRWVVVLVLDAHSGAPINYSAVSVVPGPAGVTTDSTGVVRLHMRASGQHQLRVRQFQYVPWQGTVTVTDTSGVAIVVQLRRSKTRPIPIVIEPDRPF